MTTNSSRLIVVLDSATNLPAADFNGLSDPYVKFRWRGKKYKTEVKKKTLNPVWKETFVLDYEKGKDDKILRFEIFDWDRFRSNDPLGMLELDISKLSLGVSDGKYPVQQLDGIGSGTLHVKLELLETKATSSSPSVIVTQVASSNLGFQYQSNAVPFDHQPRPVYFNGSVPNQQQPQYYAGQPYPQMYPSPQQIPQQMPLTPPTSNNQWPQQSMPLLQPISGTKQKLSSQVAKKDVTSEIQQILVNVHIEDIKAALIKFNGDKEKAIDYLLNQQIAQAAQITQGEPSPQSTQQSIGHATSHDYAGTFNPLTEVPPVSWTSMNTLFQPAPNVMGDLNTIYSGQGRKKALLIGINYCSEDCKLNGCILDVHRMKNVLVGIYGFPDIPEAIVMLTDDNSDWRFQPTRQNIIYAMKWLVQDARPGDVFFFHYSGHGSQVRNKDSTEEDGMDETILPCDFKKSGVILDDQIHALLVQPLPNNTRLTAVMDCCHSGTGMDLPFIWDSDEFDWEEEYCPFYSQGDVQLFSGCSDSQVSADMGGPQRFGNNYEAGGAMTTAFISAITANPWGHSYPSLLHHIRKSLQARGLRNQRPQLSSSQRFPINRPFNLTDIIPNHNQMLGRQLKRNRRRKKPEDSANGGRTAFGGGGVGLNPLSLLGGLAGGLLLGELLD